MATNPNLQAVLLFQHHQTTTPYMPHPGFATRAAMNMAEPKPKEKKQTVVEQPPGEETEADNNEDEEKENEENG